MQLAVMSRIGQVVLLSRRFGQKSSRISSLPPLIKSKWVCWNVNRGWGIPLTRLIQSSSACHLSNVKSHTSGADKPNKRKELGSLIKTGTGSGKVSPLKRIQDGALYYYHGFRIFGKDIISSFIILWRLIRTGKPMSRREHKQLIRTTLDLFRFTPILVFIIVPFTGWLLPFFINMFPGMLPSSFRNRESKISGQKRKLEMARRLQQSFYEEDWSFLKESKDFQYFLAKIKSGSDLTTEEILKLRPLFQTDLTLDRFTKPQLLSLCIIFNTPGTYGTAGMLRYQLKTKLFDLKADDKVISCEGLASLNLMELQDACEARGIIQEVPEDKLRWRLEQWMKLSLSEQVPASLLLLSPVMYCEDYITS